MFTVHEYHAGGTPIVGRELLRSQFVDIIEAAALGLANRRFAPDDSTPFGSVYLVIMDGEQVHAKIACRESSEKSWKLERAR